MRRPSVPGIALVEVPGLGDDVPVLTDVPR